MNLVRVLLDERMSKAFIDCDPVVWIKLEHFKEQFNRRFLGPWEEGL